MIKKQAVLVIVATLVCAACSDPCSNTVERRLPSPDGKHDAVIFVRDCGATTNYSTQLSIVARDENPVGSGNALTTELIDNNATFLVRWNGSKKLDVQLPPGTEMFEQNTEVSGIIITFDLPR